MKLFSRDNSAEKVRNPRFEDEAAGYAFRRSRTLTGSSSSQVRVAAGESPRAQLKSPRLKEHELKKHRNKLFLSSIVVFGISGLFGWLVMSFSAGKPDIQSMSQITSGQIDTATYQKIMNEYYAKRPLERFRFALNDATLLAHVQSAAPEVSRVVVNSGSGIGGSTVALGFREPLIGWKIRTTTYYIDGDGSVFQVNYFANPAVTVQDASGIDPSDGVIASNRFLSFLGKVVAGVNASGLGTVKSVTLPPGTSRQVDMTIEGRKYTYKLQMDREPTGQVADVAAITRYLDGKQLTPDYVDVRVVSKAYYR